MPEKKYRIGIDARLAGKQHAGIGRYIENLLIALAKIQPKNIEWFFFFHDRRQADEFQQVLTEHHQITFVYASIRHYSLAEQLQWPKILQEYHLDLLHVPHFNIPLFYSGKMVVTIHDLLWHQQIGPAATTLSGWKYYLKYLAYRLVTNQAVKRAVKIFVPAETVKQTALTYYPQAKDKIIVTKEGIASVFKAILQSLQDNPDEAADRQRINQLIYVGSLYPHKNIGVVLKALPELPDIILKIVCSRNVFFERTKKLVKQMNLSKQVIFTGYLEDEDLVKEISHSLALVQPSKSEGFGLTGVEAMACGTPILASDIPVFKEIYAQVPYYFDPEKVDDFIKAFSKLQQRKDYANKIKMGYQQAQQYDWQQMAQLILKNTPAFYNMTAINPIKNHQLKVALVYDRINTTYGGAEQVLLTLHKLFPDAPIYTSVYDKHQTPWAQNFKIVPSFLQNWPGAMRHHRYYVPLMPLAFESLNLSSYELIISVTSAEAKGIITRPEQVHLSYLLSPPRYLYSHKKQYLRSRSISTKPGVNWLSRHLLKYLEWWDQAAIHRPDVIIPLSHKIKQRVKKYYHLETLDPIYPPADAISLTTKPNSLKRFNLPPEYNLVVSRLVPYKNIEIAIKACQQLKHHLVIVGSGPYLNQLKKIANQNNRDLIQFLGEQSQTTVNTLMKQAKLFLSPAEDDFGLAPLQANLFGTPAIIYQQSGVAEIFKDQIQGVIMPDATTKSLVNSISHTSSLEFDPDKMRQAATQFNQTRFLFNFKNVVKTVVANKLKKNL